MKVQILGCFLIAAASSAPLLRTGLDSAYFGQTFGSIQAFPSYSTQSYATYLAHGAQPLGYHQFPTQYFQHQQYQPTPITYYTPTYLGVHQYLGSPFLDAPSFIPVQQPVIQVPIPSFPQFPQVAPVIPPGVLPQVENENQNEQPQPSPEQEQQQEIANDAVDSDDDTVTIESA